jgi:hypothetical protein
VSNIKLNRLTAGQATELQGSASDLEKLLQTPIEGMTLEALGFPVVALPRVEHMHGPGEDEKDAVLVLYVAATETTQRLVIVVGGDGTFSDRLSRQKETAIEGY